MVWRQRYFAACLSLSDELEEDSQPPNRYSSQHSVMRYHQSYLLQKRLFRDV